MAEKLITGLTRRTLHRLREEPEVIYTDGNGRRLHGRVDNNGVVGEKRRQVLRVREFRVGPDERFLNPGPYGGSYYNLEAGHAILEAEAIRQGFTRRLSTEEVAAFVDSNQQRRAAQMEAAAARRGQPTLV